MTPRGWENRSFFIGEKQMQTYTPKIGETIKHIAHVLVEMANSRKEEPATANFCDIILTANPGDNADAIAQYYRDEFRRRHEQKYGFALKDTIIPEDPRMSLRDEAGWKRFVEVYSTDVYNAYILRYAERWACLMEDRLTKGDTIEQCAKETSALADTEGISGYIYGVAVAALTQVWVHGEQFRHWIVKDTPTWHRVRRG